nr:LOW QUALITY PROTEIN: galanin receptor 2a-like [Hydra vulgaris]
MMLPHFFKLCINVCLNMNSTVVLYYLFPLSIVSTVPGERISCKENFTTPFLQYPAPSCGGNKNIIYSFCEPSRISKSSTTLLCLTTINFRLITFTAQCSSYEYETWKFYIEPLFPKYSIYVIYMIFGALIFLITTVINLAVLVAVETTKLYKSLNTAVYAMHMTLIDLLLALSAQVLHLSVTIIIEEGYFHRYILTSKNTFESILNWYNHIDFILINAQFANLALLSVERCFAIFKPYWHLQVVTPRKCIYSLALVWLYTIVVYVINFYTIDIRKVQYISFVLAYGIPALIIILTFFIAIWKVRSAKKSSESSYNFYKNQQLAVTVKLVKMLVFLLCWIPFFACEMMLLRSPNINVMIAAKWTKLLSYCHCIFDPILYSISNSEIKKGIKRIILTIACSGEQPNKKDQTFSFMMDTPLNQKNSKLFAIENNQYDISNEGSSQI